VSVSIALAAGGTGGHLFPALAVADAVRRLQPDARLTFIGSSRALDRRLLDARGVDVAATEVVSFAGAADIPKTAFRLAKAVKAADAVLEGRTIDAVLGFGGYPSLPPLLAAAKRRKPRLVHEANALPRLGLANRIAARTGAEVWGGFATTGSEIRGGARHCGVPIREDIAGADRPGLRAEARRRFGRSPDGIVVLVVGGSLGARRVNEAIAALADAPAAAGIEFIWSTGADHYPGLAERFDKRRTMHLAPFIDDMALAYAAADLVVSRAGASTVAELEALGVRAVLVPLAIARFGEQDANARALVARGGAAILPEPELDADRLARVIADLLREQEPPPAPHHGRAAHELAARILERAGQRR